MPPREKRGKKAIKSASRDLPPESAPPILQHDLEKIAYGILRGAAILNPKVTSAHTESLCHAARLKVRYEKISRAVAGLDEITVDAGNGGQKVHPLLPELRATESLYLSALGQCLLTPRATTAARQPLGELDKKAAGSKAGQQAAEEIAPAIAKLFKPRAAR